MSRTLIRQETQIRQSDLYDDTLAAGATLESVPVNIEDDLNGLRSQVNKIIGQTNWYDALVNGDLTTVGSDVDALETKKLLFRSQVLTDITVPATQNFVVLDVSSLEAPSEVAAVDAATTAGAVVAFHAGTFGTHSLDEVSGATAIGPKNLLIIRDAVTGAVLQAADGKDIYGLIQSEIVTNGHTFNDTTQQVQISFVKENVAGNDLVAVPVADIENQVINYSYVRRLEWSSIPETAFLSGVFIDLTSASTDITLDKAIDNQIGNATQAAKDIVWEITDTNTLDFQATTGGQNLLRIAPGAGSTDTVEFNVDVFDVNNGTDANFLNGALFDTGGTTINVGVTAGQVDSAAALTLASAAGGDLTINAAGEIVFVDTNKAASTFAGPLLLSDTSAEWSAYETAFGEVSLLNAITQAYSAGGSTRTKAVAVVTIAAAADVNMTGTGGGANLDANLLDYSALVFVDDVDVYFNGVLLRNGADASANHDVYPGDVLTTGDIKFEFKAKINDVITMVTWT